MASTDPSLLDITDKDVREKLSLWDRRGEPTAPLTDAQSDSVAEVRAAAETLPVPSEVRRAKCCLNACPAPRSGCILMNYHLMSVVSSSSSLKCGCVMPAMVCTGPSPSQVKVARLNSATLDRRCCQPAKMRMVNGKWTAFIQRFSNQWPLKALYDAEHSPIHAHIHPPTAVSTTQGDSQLVRSS